MAEFDEADPAGEDKKVFVTEEQFINIFKFILRCYVDAHDLDTEQMRQVTIKEFVTWCVGEGHFGSEEELIEVSTALKVPREALEFVWDKLQDPFEACEVLIPIWDVLRLSGQPPARHQPVCFMLMLTAMFNDRTVLQIQCQTPWDPNKPITDGFLCALFKAQTRYMTNTIAAEGLDRLWDEHAKPIPGRLLNDIRKIVVKPGEEIQGKDGE